MLGLNVRNIRLVLSLGAVASLALFAAGCSKLKARDNLNEGVNAFKAGKFDEAADHFKLAVELDPQLPAARLYLATAYVQQYVPGTETPENKKFAEAAMEEFTKVLEADPKNLLATQSIASLYYSQKILDKAVEWNKKVIDVDPNNKEAYYTLGVIAWTQFVAADREARIGMKMKMDDPGPLKDKTVREELKAKYWDNLTQGLEYEKKALAIDPEYEIAMAYMNLLLRYRADVLDTKEAYDADVKEADNWVEKNLQTVKIKAERKEKKNQGGTTPAP